MEADTWKLQRGQWNYGTEKLHGVGGGVEIKEAIQELEKGIGLWDPEGGGLGMKAREGVFQTSNPCSSRHR